ncbi:MAG: hypothetical protein V3U98_10735 [Acidobacteriota bacterium]
MTAPASIETVSPARGGGASRPAAGARVRRWLVQNLPRWLERTFIEPQISPVCIEIDASQLLLAVARRERRSRRARVALLRQQPLAEGLIEPSALHPNIGDPEALAAEVRRLFAGMPPPEAVSVLLPDSVAKISIMELTSLPRSHRDALEMVRFRLKKTVPFRIEDAQVDFHTLEAAPGSFRLLTTVAYRPVLKQYQTAIEALGTRAGMVTLSTLSLLDRCWPEATSAGGDGDVLLANVTPRTLTLAVFRGTRLVLFRSKTLSGGSDGDAGERVRVVRREYQTTLAYYQEKLEGRGFSRALTRLVGWSPQQLFGTEDGTRLERIDPMRWAEPDPELGAPPADAGLFAPALSLALRGVL